MAFVLKQNDTSPQIQATLKDSDNAVIDLSGATVRFHMKAYGATSTKVDAAATIVGDAVNGVVKYVWQSGDTDTVGTYNAEFEVTYGDGNIETFPNDKNLTIVVKAELA